VLGLFVGGFSIIIVVNLALAFNAVRTFPGLETDSAYVASQRFNADRAAQDALGWEVAASLEDGTLRVSVRTADGVPVRPEVTAAVLGRATTVSQDRTPAFAWDGRALVAPADPGAGNWNLRLELAAPDGTPFRRRVPLMIRP
jgi:nitrogen fixation protein FixH